MFRNDPQGYENISEIWKYSDLRLSSNRKHFLVFVYVWNGAFANSNGALAVGNASEIEVQTRVLFWA